MRKPNRSRVPASLLTGLITGVVLVYSFLAMQVIDIYWNRDGNSDESSNLAQAIAQEDGMAADASEELSAIASADLTNLQSESSKVSTILSGGGPSATSTTTSGYLQTDGNGDAFDLRAKATVPLSPQGYSATESTRLSVVLSVRTPVPSPIRATTRADRILVETSTRILRTPTRTPTSANRISVVAPVRTPVPSPTRATATATRVPVIVVLPTTLPSPTQLIKVATPVPEVAPTQPPVPSPTLLSLGNTLWLPDRSQWPPHTNYQAAAVPPGTPYWRMVRVLYCDFNDTRNNCPNLPGGGAGTSTYVMLLDGSGKRAEAPLLSPPSQEQKSPTDICNCNYAFPDSSTAIQVGGYPSDSIGGLDLYSVQANRTNFHVRYFLTFQLSTK